MTKSPALLAGLMLLAVSSTAGAQTKPDGQWHGTGSAGLSLSSGNGSTSALSVNADAAVETADDKTSFYASILNGRSKAKGADTLKTSDLARVGARYDRNINAQLYGFVGGELERDGVQSLSLRTSINGGLGYKVIRDASTTFDVFGGLGYTRADFKEPLIDKRGAELILGEESTHKLSASTSFKQRFVVYPGFKSANGYRSTFDASLSTALAGNLQGTVGLSSNFNSKVATGLSKTSTLLLVGVSYKF